MMPAVVLRATLIQICSLISEGVMTKLRALLVAITCVTASMAAVYTATSASADPCANRACK
jgi:hypothetical protein